MSNQIEIKDLDSVVSDAPKGEKSELEVLKELFKQKEIESKTELSADQIILFNQKRTIAKLLKWKELDETLNDFMLLQISLNRKGRAEFIDGFKSNRDRDMMGQENQRKWWNPTTWNR
jgi:hypothetical protein